MDVTSLTMEKLFQDLLDMAGVHGLFLISANGNILFDSLSGVQSFSENSAANWKIIADCIDDFVEMDLVYEDGRYYVRKDEEYLLVLLLTHDESVAMLQLNIDIVMSEFKKKAKNERGLLRFLNFKI